MKGFQPKHTKLETPYRSIMHHLSCDTCTDACTHSDQGVHAEKGYLAHANKIAQGHTYMCKTLEEGEHTFIVR